MASNFKIEIILMSNQQIFSLQLFILFEESKRILLHNFGLKLFVDHASIDFDIAWHFLSAEWTLFCICILKSTQKTCAAK